MLRRNNKTTPHNTRRRGLQRHTATPLNSDITSDKTKHTECGFGGPEDACWHLEPKFAASNPAEAVAFFRAKTSPARLPSEGK
jgi:hypothetical protein